MARGNESSAPVALRELKSGLSANKDIQPYKNRRSAANFALPSRRRTFGYFLRVVDELARQAAGSLAYVPITSIVKRGWVTDDESRSSVLRSITLDLGSMPGGQGRHTSSGEW